MQAAGDLHVTLHSQDGFVSLTCQTSGSLCRRRLVVWLTVCFLCTSVCGKDLVPLAALDFTASQIASLTRLLCFN